MSELLLKIDKLNTRIFSDGSVVNAVCDFDLELKRKEILTIIGESGCGKTMSVLSITNILPQSAKIVSGEIKFDDRDIKFDSERELQKIRGCQISYIFQDPVSSLNPLFTIGEQIKEVYQTHTDLSNAESKSAVLEVLELVNLKPAQNYYSYFPHQLSGGMNQRAMIAMAIASKPKLIIADEPTSSLDRITELKILGLLKELNDKINVSIILITHNISIIENFSDSVAIMYAGRIVEKAAKDDIFKNPKHPYTKALLDCRPKINEDKEFLNSIVGNVPDLSKLPSGCKFHPRCPFVMDICKEKEPEFKEFSNHQISKCYL
ncbi:MAG: ABC transporter ATP-binding protein [Candidatus Omnitrophota bacterium]